MHFTGFQTYAERSHSRDLGPLSVYLLRLMDSKRTNLAISANVTTTSELLRLAEDVGDHICVLKTHGDIICDFSEKSIKGLNEVSQRKRFLVFEDRKFGDIEGMSRGGLTPGMTMLILGVIRRHSTAPVQWRVLEDSRMGTNYQRSHLRRAIRRNFTSKDCRQSGTSTQQLCDYQHLCTNNDFYRNSCDRFEP